MADGLATNIGAILAMNAQAATKGAAEGREQDYTSKQAGVLGSIDTLTGTKTSDLSKKFRDYFKSTIDAAVAKHEASIKNFDPKLLSSPSYKNAMGAIGGQMKDYGTKVMYDMGRINSAIGKASEASSQRVGSQASDYARAAVDTTKAATQNLANLASSNVGSLRGTTAAGTGLIAGTSERGASRLYGTLSAPIQAFQSVQGSQAFSNLYNPYFMRMAAAPPTQRSDVGSMQGLYKYNV
jgi:hypothetical protein